MGHHRREGDRPFLRALDFLQAGTATQLTVKLSRYLGVESSLAMKQVAALLQERSGPAQFDKGERRKTPAEQNSDAARLCAIRRYAVQGLSQRGGKFRASDFGSGISSGVQRHGAPRTDHPRHRACEEMRSGLPA
jgi:hypothetical protein